MSTLSSLPTTSTTPLLLATLHDRVAGVLIGSALGDAIGLYTEFLTAASSATAYPSRSFTLTGPNPTPFKLDSHRAPKDPGQWTDDTDHALLLLLSFLHTASTTQSQPQLPHLPTQQSFAHRLQVWAQTGFPPLGTMPLGLGRLVGTVISSKGFTTNPEQVAREYWERTGRRVAPNGSLMRTHPLGVICLLRGEEEAFEIAARISRATHVDPRCVVACLVGTGLVRAVVRGEIRAEGDLEGILDEQAAIGYVYKTLGSGVVLLRMAMKRVEESKRGMLDRTRMFEELITDLIMRGGDADTNACFAGALLGGHLGYSYLPDHWKHGLKYEEWLLGKSDALCQVLGLKEGDYDGKGDKDTEVHAGQPVPSQEQMEVRWMVLQQDTQRKMEAAAKAATSKASGSGWSLPWAKDKAKR